MPTMTTMDTLDELPVFSSTGVIISRIGDSGEEVYYPGNLSMYSVKSRSFKGWIVARNYAGNALIFNAIIPGNLAIRAFDDELAIRFGKIPSLSYTDKRNKPIPTLWCAKMPTVDDFHKFFGLLNAFSQLAKAVNTVDAGIPAALLPSSAVRPSLAIRPPAANLPAPDILRASDIQPADDSVPIPDVAKKNKKTAAKKTMLKKTASKKAPAKKALPKIESPKKLFNGKDKANISFDSSVNLLDDGSDIEEKKTPAKGGYDLSDDSDYDFGSPIFAQSQDIYASLGRPNPGRRNSAEDFSPLKSDEESYYYDD